MHNCIIFYIMIPFIYIDELPEDEQKEFTLWLFGQTAPLIEGQEHRLTAYASDYKRWIFKIKQWKNN